MSDYVKLTLFAIKMYLPQSVQSIEKLETYPVNHVSSKSRNYSFLLTFRISAFLLNASESNSTFDMVFKTVMV